MATYWYTVRSVADTEVEVVAETHSIMTAMETCQPGVALRPVSVEILEERGGEEIGDGAA